MQSFLIAGENIPQRPLISVCCICHRHRTPEDTWAPLDNPEENDESEFTHGFCPDCIREYYPKVSNKLEKIQA